MSTQPGSIGRASMLMLRQNPNVTRALPPHPETFTRGEYPELTPSLWRRYLKQGLIERVGYIDDDEDNHAIYRLTERASEYIEENIDDRETFPCGHGGVRCVGDDEYSCTVESCDGVYGRELAEQVIDASTGES